MKAKYIFYIKGDKEAIESFYEMVSTSLPRMYNWEVVVSGGRAIRRAGIIKGELIFTDLIDRPFTLPKLKKYSHKKTKRGIKTRYF